MRTLADLYLDTYSLTTGCDFIPYLETRGYPRYLARPIARILESWRRNGYVPAGVGTGIGWREWRRERIKAQLSDIRALLNELDDAHRPL